MTKDPRVMARKYEDLSKSEPRGSYAKAENMEQAARWHHEAKDYPKARKTYETAADLYDSVIETPNQDTGKEEATRIRRMLRTGLGHTHQQPYRHEHQHGSKSTERLHHLEHRIAQVFVVLCFVMAAAMLAGPLTGNVIVETSPRSSAVGSLLFFIIGLVGLYVLVHRR